MVDDFKSRGGSPWGSPPGGGNGSGRGPTPPDIDEIIKNIQKTINRFIPGNGAKSGKPIILGLVILAIIWIASGLYRVLPDEQGVVLRFGKYSKTTQPGLNYHIPYPVETVLTPKVTKVNRMDVGFRSETDSGFSSGGVADVPEESLMLTGDENIVNIDFSVFWVIKDAGKFLFNLRSPEKSIKSVSESVMREVIANSKISSVLAEGRRDIEIKSIEAIQTVLDNYGSGVQITQLQLQKVDPPDQVIDSFRDVQRARADKEKFINEAIAYRNDIIPKARGEAAKIVQESEAYKKEVVARSEGDANRFNSILKSYKKNEDVTKNRIYLETLEEVLQNANKVIIDTKQGSGVIPYLPLPEIKKRKKKQEKEENKETNVTNEDDVKNVQ